MLQRIRHYHQNAEHSEVVIEFDYPKPRDDDFGCRLRIKGHSFNVDHRHARFPGQWYQLETGLHYNWHRHYDPTLGRYTQPDPIGLGGGANRFAYALANPIMNIDSDGKFAIALPFAILVLEAIGGVAVGVVAGMVIDGLLDPPAAPPLPLPLPIPAPKMCLDGTNWNVGGGGNHNSDPDCDEE